MPTLYDAPRCPYCARARIVLAEKQVAYEHVLVDLDDRPQWLVELNPPDGRVPVLDVDGVLLPESRAIARYLEEACPEPALLPADPLGRALVELALERFDTRVGNAYYRLLRGRTDDPGELAGRLAAFDRDLERSGWLVGEACTLADLAYVPWLLRAESRLGIDVRGYPAIGDWLERLAERPSVAAEMALAAALTP